MSDGADGPKQLDRSAFLAPRPPHLSEEEWEDAQEHLRRDLRRGWNRFLQVVEEGGYPSPEWLADLLEEGPIPEDLSARARTYVAGRIRGTITQTGRPVARPDNLHVANRILFASTGGLPPPQAYAVWWVRRRSRRYRAIATRQEPRRENKPRMRYIENRSVWVVRNPKKEARRRVAARIHVSERTLETWEREARDGWDGTGG